MDLASLFLFFYCSSHVRIWEWVEYYSQCLSKISGRGPSFSISAWLAGTVKKKKKKKPWFCWAPSYILFLWSVKQAFFPKILQQFWFGVAQYLVWGARDVGGPRKPATSLGLPLLLRVRTCSTSRRALEERHCAILAELETSTLAFPRFFQWVLLCCPDWPQTHGLPTSPP